jgi:carbon monoxide dehydrogenase subunit G
MRIAGRQHIEASRSRVWTALNDPNILRECIPGCHSLEMLGDNRMRAVAIVRIGPIGAKFKGEVVLSDLQPPRGYRIDGEGQGGAAGFAKGGAQVRLEEDGREATWLDYEVDAQVGGRLAQIGGPLIDATAKQIAGLFFKKLAHVLAAPASGPEAFAGPELAAGRLTESNQTPPAFLPARPAATHTTASPPTLSLGLAVVCAGLLGFILGRQASGWDAAGAWPGLAIGFVLLVAAAAGFSFGRATR